jgi:hypothetical protein
MPKISFIFIALFLVVSCKNASEQKTNTSESTSNETSVTSDSAAIAETVHGFYKWYGAFYVNPANNTGFTNDKGKVLKLDQTKFDAYFANFKNSGFVSSDFVANEAAYYKDCEVLWQKENKDEVVSCLDYDRYFCSQDVSDVTFYSTAAVKSKVSGDKATAFIGSDKENETPTLKVELKKENGKWLVSQAGCSEK